MSDYGLPVRKPTIDDCGGAPFAFHDQACAACHEKHAILDLSCGVFRVCGDCRRRGWGTVQLKRWQWRVVEFMNSTVKWHR